MYAYIKGRLVAKKTDRIVIEAGGIGYNVFYPQGRILMLPAPGSEVQIYTYTSVREDALQLYGFASEDELELYKQLLAVSGIGPKVALGILSAITVESLCKAIQNKQATVLTKLPGIGKKSAERLILELKDKVGFAAGDEEVLTLEMEGPLGDDMISEAQAALVALGYSQAEIAPVLKKATKCKTTEEVIKLALKQLNRF